MVTIEELIQHPLFLLAVGAVITGFLVPSFTRRWQDRKVRTEIQVNLTKEMSETIGYAIAKLFTAIARYRDIVRAGEEPTFSHDDAAQLYKELETWYAKSYALSAELRAYLPSFKVDNSFIDTRWAEYSDLIMTVWLLAAKLYYVASTSEEEIAKFLKKVQESKWKEGINVDWSKIGNRDVKELQKLSNELERYGYSLAVSLDTSKIKI